LLQKPTSSSLFQPATQCSKAPTPSANDPLCKEFFKWAKTKEGKKEKISPPDKMSPGTDVMILKIFSPKNSAKKLAFLTHNKAKFCKKFIITLVFEKNANFFAENWQKSPKIVIITSTPGKVVFTRNTNLFCLPCTYSVGRHKIFVSYNTNLQIYKFCVVQHKFTNLAR
jgi:hypothetical protein